VIGAPEGEAHALAVSMVADMFRGAGFDVIDLGHNLPAQDFVRAVEDARPVSAVAVSVSTSGSLRAAQELMAALRASIGVPVVVGGWAVEDEAHALDLGADAYAADGPAAVDYVDSLVTG
jgi:5-methyltetrahydrofolate--homocysteine methyltransferase